MDQGKQWTNAQNLALLSSWIQATKNPIIGTNQCGQVFWESVCNAYLVESKGDTQSWRALSTRFGTIAAATQKFSGNFSFANASPMSGSNEQDIIKAALAYYAVDAEISDAQAKLLGNGEGDGNDKGKTKSFNFEFLNCWDIVRHCPKFLELYAKAQQQKDNNSSSASDSVSLDKGPEASKTAPKSSAPERPMGCKRVKREVAQEKFQNKLSFFMDDNKSGSGEVSGYLKIMTGALLVAIRDGPPKDAERQFLASAHSSIFTTSTPEAPSCLAVASTSNSGPAAHHNAPINLQDVSRGRVAGSPLGVLGDEFEMYTDYNAGNLSFENASAYQADLRFDSDRDYSDATLAL